MLPVSLTIDLELHLLEYKQRMLEYVQRVKTDKPQHITPFQLSKIKAFSGPYDPDGYNDDSISDDLITDAYLEFCAHTRIIESEAYARILSGWVELMWNDEDVADAPQ
jgi:hypothetical protein